MKQKIMSILMVVIGIVFLAGCDKAREIKTTWNIEDAFGNAYQMNIKDKEIIIIDGKEKQKMSFKQGDIGSTKGIKYYGLTMDGKNYSIIFPEEKNYNIALFIKRDKNNYTQGSLVFAMNKKEKPNYTEYNKEYLK